MLSSPIKKTHVFGLLVTIKQSAKCLSQAKAQKQTFQI